MALAWLAACAQPAAPGHASEKPVAPVVVTLDAQAGAAGTWTLTLHATPTVDLDALELTLPGVRDTRRAARAGVEQTLTATVALAVGEGRDVAGGALAIRGKDRRSRAAIAHVGAASAKVAPLPKRTITLPGGARVAEVRP